jgi:plastocyanin
VGMGKATVRFLAACLLWTGSVAFAEGVQVTGHLSVTAVNGAARAPRDVSVALWLTPAMDSAAPVPRPQVESSRPKLIQKNKAFDPHILVVQVGSEVDFPNHDPFFHNVFSLFNGKRFDLGLYEAGSTRGVHFDRPGICYIFCNIHPQMSAVVVVVNTPYFAVSDARGQVSIPGVSPGRYELNLWEEHCSPKTLKQLSRQITLGEGASSLANVHVQETDEPATAHLNKYGKQYDPDVFASPLYVQP